MIDGPKPYPTMKDSGVDWHGEVPAHWEVRRIKTLFREKDERSDDRHGELLSLTRSHGLILQTEASNRIASIEDLSNYKVCRPGDLVMNRMQAWSGMFAVPSQEGLISPDYSVFELVSESEVKYFEHLFKTSLLVGQFAQKSRGIGSGFNRLYTADFGSIPTIVPPLPEQTAIVRFLDHADRRIRRYIRAKQKLIALLEEQKQAIIHQAVTRGLDSAISLEPTRNPWFSEVPNTWKVTSMRRVISRSIDGPHHSPEYLDSGIPFLSARNIKVDRWSLEDAKFISQADYETFCQRVKPEVGDVLYTKGGTTGVARAVDLDFPFQIWVHVAVLKVRRDRVLSHYLATVLNTPRCYEQSQLYTRGATNQDLGLGRMKDIVLPLPPLAEQSKIIEWVTATQAPITRGVHAAFRQIELIRDYRTRLIADVVTGKLDVREVSPPEVDPLEAEGILTDTFDPDSEPDSKIEQANS